MSAELKPCAHCGGPSRMVVGDGPFFGRVQVECEHCRVATFYYEEAVAAKIWNRRALAAPSQPAEPVAQPAEQFEHLDVQNHRLRRGMQKLMARLTELLDEDQFAHCESIVREAGVEPPVAQAAQQPTFEACAKCVAPDHCSFFTCVAEEPDLPSHPAAEGEREDKPVAYTSEDRLQWLITHPDRAETMWSSALVDDGDIPLYRRPVRELTDDEIDAVGLRFLGKAYGNTDRDFARLIERALLSKATGEGKA